MAALSDSRADVAPEWVRMADAAAALGVNRTWVHRLAARGTLVVKETPYGRLVSMASIEAYKKSPARALGRPSKG